MLKNRKTEHFIDMFVTFKQNQRDTTTCDKTGVSTIS